MRPFCLVMAAALFLSGCLVNDDEFERARRQKEALTAELAKLRQSNDQLHQEISRLYADREVLSGHVAMTTAVALNNRLMPRVRPAAPPAAPARPPQPPPRPAARPPQVSPGPAGAGASPPPPPGDAVRPRPGGAVDWGRQ